MAITVPPYPSFARLAQHEQNGRDYTIRHRPGSSGLLVMAPHGGGIEPGTGDMAGALAGRRHAFYCFKGLKKEGNRILHITSNRFDEPLAMHMLQEAQWVVTLHGCRGDDPIVWIGGRDVMLGDAFAHCLEGMGIPSRRAEHAGLRGLHPDNICNRGGFSAGVQLEVSLGLRRMLFTDLFRRRIRYRTPLFYRMAHMLQSCLQEVETRRWICIDPPAALR
jgi:phage replication-related protein YjqB (UPF0714/DUF867 family)